jgi:hypothetical protein
VTLCVYALTGGAARVSARGLAGERLHVYAHGPVAAVAGRLSRAPDASPELLRRYDGAMRRLAGKLPAVLPVRFGTCFNDPAELAFVLRSRGASLVRALAHVRNRVQMTVRLIEDPEQRARIGRRGAPLSAPVATGLPSALSRRPHRPRGSGTAYLRDRAEAVARDHDVAGFAPVRDAVRRWLRDERIERRGAVVSVYHLIPRASADRYRRAIARAAATCELRLVVSGPWPPYAFADTL